MPQYTTGELAKICGVSVRTVQYYDTRGILAPSALSEGGRRLYSQDDVSKLKVICFLRDLELPIESIKQLLQEAHPERVISILLEEQERVLQAELTEKQQKLDRTVEAKRTLAMLPSLSVGSIQDVAHIMENRKQLRRLRIWMLGLGFVSDAIQVATLMLWILKGLWWVYIMGIGAAIGLGVLISWLYYSRTAYICPECHRIFKPKLGQMLLARHTPNTRKLTCTCCAYHGFCVETYEKGKQYA